MLCIHQISSSQYFWHLENKQISDRWRNKFAGALQTENSMDKLHTFFVVWLLRWRSNYPIFKRRIGVIQLTGLTLPHFSSLSEAKTWVPNCNVICSGIFFFTFNELRWDVIVRLLALVKFVDHHGLNVLNMIIQIRFEILKNN